MSLLAGLFVGFDTIKSSDKNTRQYNLNRLFILSLF